MATPEQILALEQAILDQADAYAREFAILWREFLVQWSQLDTPTDRVMVFGLLANLRELLAEAIDATDTISQTWIELNGGATGLETVVSEYKSQMYLVNSIAMEEETNSLLTLLILGGVALAGSTLLEQRSNTAIIDRIKNTFDQSILGLTSSITKTIGSQDPKTRYTYVGGIIPTTRAFCATHSGKTYTLKEIERIWSGDWQGKREGDPLVTRGGWNCRHLWIKET